MPGIRFRLIAVSSVQRGISLIELMVGILISSLLMLGMYQIFTASQVTFQMQEGLSRVQENGRFALDYLQRNIRMAGFMGCGSDIGRTNQASFVNHLSNADGTIPAATGHAYRFQRPIEAYTQGAMLATTDFTNIAASGASTQPLDGTDVLILRIFSEESIPVIAGEQDGAFIQLTLRLANTASPVIAAGAANAIYALQNCRSADVFQAALSGQNLIVGGLTAPNIYKDTDVKTCSNGTNGCPWDFRVSNAFLNAKPLVGPATLNAELHRAEYLGIYVRRNVNGIPSLYVRRFARAGATATNGVAPIGDPEELAEGIERMLLRFGVDTDGDGGADVYRTAAEIVTGMVDATAIDAAWRRVISVRVGIVALSSNSAAVAATVDGAARSFRVLGTTFTPTENVNNMRQVYETTIALRNRLLN